MTSSVCEEGKSSRDTACRLGGLTFEFTGYGDEESQQLQVPYLAIEDVLQQPILGTMEVLVNKSDNTSTLINFLTNIR